jgi:hypothetical protein
VPAARPLLDLRVRQAGQPLALAVGCLPPEHCEAGDPNPVILPSIHACSSAGSVFRTRSQYPSTTSCLTLCVSSTSVRAGSGMRSSPRLFSKLGHTWSKAGPRSIGAIWWSICAKGEYLRRLVHQDDAACRVRGRVHSGDRGGDRVAHDDRALNAQRVQQPVDLSGDVLQRCRLAAAVAVCGQVWSCS